MDSTAWCVSGPDIGRRFSIKVLGLPRSAQSLAKTAHGLLRPANHGDPWRDLQVGTGAGQAVKLYVNKDASPKQLRLALVARTAREVIRSLAPGLEVKVVYPQWHPGRSLSSFLRVDGIDVAAITAESRVLEPSIKLDPQFLQSPGLGREPIISGVLSRLASRSKVPDTTSWV